MAAAPEMLNRTQEPSKEVQVFGYFKHKERSSPSGPYFLSHRKGLAESQLGEDDQLPRCDIQH